MRFDLRSLSVAAGLTLAAVGSAGIAAPPQMDHAAAFMRALIADRGAAAPTTRLLEAAARDDPQAEFDLGVLYARGRGVAKDYAEAGRWFRKAADHRIAAAQFNLGVMYAHSLGVPRDYALAHMWFSLAAAQGEEDAAKARDGTAARMTASEIADSERMAGAWRPSNPGLRL